MTAEYAADIATWRYPAPYDCYDMTGADPGFLVDPASGFHALIDDGGLIGFRSFGPDGRVPGGVYDSSALDTGGGLRPELTGRGLGREAISTGLAFGARQFAPPAFRMTIAAFNVRAQNVVRALGFEAVDHFAASTDGRDYDIFTGPAPTPSRVRPQREPSELGHRPPPGRPAA
jgi:[ribosomal protein S18]-alanine N-acetyltransferase